MKPTQFARLILLAVIWGASFLLIKWSAPEIGVFALVEIRALGATLLLIPLVYLQNNIQQIRQYWRQLAIVGVLNTAIPFCLFNYSLMDIEAGLAAILNATAPMFGVLIAYLFLKESIGKLGLLGVLLGFFGVVVISFEQIQGANTSVLPILAILLATCCYGIAAAYIKGKLSHINPFALAGGSQLFTTIILLPIALTSLPETMPSGRAISSALVLAFICTGLAYVLYFDLIAKVGPSRAMAVGYLIPLSGIIWGYLLLNESLSAAELGGGALIMLGVMFATNVIQRFFRKSVINV